MKYTAAILYFFAVTCLIAMVFGFVGGGLGPVSSWCAILGGATVAVWSVWRERTVDPEPFKPGIAGWLAIGFWTLFSLRCFLWLVFKQGDELRVLSANNLGDMSLHITFIRYLASGVPFWPENPICTCTPLTYPVGMDLLNAVLLSAGVELTIGLTWVGLVGAFCIGSALWRWGGAFVLAAILCNGGTIVFEEWMKPGARWEFRDYLTVQAWNSIPLALLVTQRGLLFAVPAAVLLLDKWRVRFLGASRPPGWQLPGWAELLLYSSMPLFHLHTFLLLSAMLGWWIVAVPGSRKDVFRLGIRALAPATILTYAVTGGFFGTGMIGLDFGWTWEAPDSANPNWDSFVTYLFRNFGAYLLVAAWLPFALFRDRRSPETFANIHIVIPAIGMLLSCFFFRYAPWDWDNSKLINLAYLAVIPSLWIHVVSRVIWPFRAFLLFVMFFSGFISLAGGMSSNNRGYAIASVSNIEMLAAATKHISVDERFASYPTWNHPLLLNGRKVAMGFPGHIFSHGIGSSERDRKLEALMVGAPNWREIASELDVRYMFWGEMERTNYPTSAKPWITISPRIAAGEWGEIYDLNGISPR